MGKWLGLNRLLTKMVQRRVQDNLAQLKGQNPYTRMTDPKIFNASGIGPLLFPKTSHAEKARNALDLEGSFENLLVKKIKPNPKR